MKLLLHCLVLLALFATKSFSQPSGAEYFYTTNLYLVGTWTTPNSTNSATLTEHAWHWPWQTDFEFVPTELGIYNTNRILISGGPASANGQVIIEAGGLGINLNPYLGGVVTVTGDLTVSGTINYAGAIVWNTNNVSVTNATWANNVWYPTNAQTTTVDMGIPYADYDTAAAPTFAGITGTSSTNYQTAVVFVRQNPPSANVLSISIPAVTTRQGTFNLTNVTVLTWFYNPHVPFTNVVALPLY